MGKTMKKPCDLFYEDCHYVDFVQLGQCAGYFTCLKGYTIVSGCPIYTEIMRKKNKKKLEKFRLE